MNCNAPIYRHQICVRLDREENSASGCKNESQYTSEQPAQMRLCNRVMFYNGKSLREIQC